MLLLAAFEAEAGIYWAPLLMIPAVKLLFTLGLALVEDGFILLLFGPFCTAGEELRIRGFFPSIDKQRLNKL